MVKNYDEGEGGEPVSQQHMETVKRLFEAVRRCDQASLLER